MDFRTVGADKAVEEKAIAALGKISPLEGRQPACKFYFQ